MKLVGFQLLDIYLTLDGKSHDLHNDFDFRRFSYDLKERTLSLEWTRSSRDGPARLSPQAIEVAMSGVSHFAASPRRHDLPYTEDDCLDCVSYVEPSASVEESFTTEAPLEDQWHFAFQFMSGLVLRVQAERAVCVAS